MTRATTSWQKQPQFPAVTAEPKPYAEADYYDCDLGSEAIRRSPYKAGDVVLIESGPAFVSHVFSERLFSGYCIPRYRVFPLRKDGKAWSKAWRYVFPGDIYRGHHRAAA